MASSVKRLLVTLIYLIVSATCTAIVASLASKHLGGDELNGGGDLKKTVRESVSRPQDLSFSEVGGLEEVKKDLMRSVVTPLLNPDVFFSGPKALRPPRGVLLSGPPGTGKTMLARAVASEANANFMSLSSSTLESKWFGESSKIVREAFRMARTELQPCIIFFDEIDGVGRRRNEADQSCTYSLKTELLKNLDGEAGEDSSSAVMVLACTNCESSLDPALRRRLPKVLHVDKPDLEARVDILVKMTFEEATSVTPRKGKKIPTVRLVAELTEGFTGSDLSALYSEASSLRYHSADVERILKKREVKDGRSVMAMLGPLSLSHWKAALSKKEVA